MFRIYVPRKPWKKGCFISLVTRLGTRTTDACFFTWNLTFYSKGLGDSVVSNQYSSRSLQVIASLRSRLLRITLEWRDCYVPSNVSQPAISCPWTLLSCHSYKANTQSTVVLLTQKESLCFRYWVQDITQQFVSLACFQAPFGRNNISQIEWADVFIATARALSFVLL